MTAQPNCKPRFAAQFANSDPSSPQLLVEITNDLQIDESGWAQIAPMGDFPGMALIDEGGGRTRKVRALQRIDRQAVANMVNEFKEARKGLKRFLNGCPIYVGHPDVPGYETRYPDKSPKGVFADLAERDGAFCGIPVFTNEGQELVETRQYRALSGRWSAEPCGEEILADGQAVPVFRPTRLISAGLTNQPNLPVQLLNEADPRANCSEAARAITLSTLMKKKIITLCAAFGITLANDASDGQTEAALDQLTRHAAGAATLANEKAALAADLQRRDEAISTLTTERDAAHASFANERAAHTATLLDAAIAEGRIVPADRAAWAARLATEANFANEAAALKKATPAIKTRSVTITRGDRKLELATAQDRRDIVAELVNEACREEGLDIRTDYDRAFAKVQRRFPQLFEAMRQPEPTTQNHQ